jgi:hypothetical protein
MAGEVRAGRAEVSEAQIAVRWRGEQGCSSRRGSSPHRQMRPTGRSSATRVTAVLGTPKAAATAASAAWVALPPGARSPTRTTRRPACSPPTRGCTEPGLTQRETLTAPLCRLPGPRDGAAAGWPLPASRPAVTG